MPIGFTLAALLLVAIEIAKPTRRSVEDHQVISGTQPTAAIPDGVIHPADFLLVDKHRQLQETKRTIVAKGNRLHLGPTAP
jgi:hypothetical protein